MRVNVLYLHQLLHQYVGGDLTMLGEIPEDPAVSQAVRRFLPVIESAPDSSAAKGLLAVSAAIERLISASAGRSKEETKQPEEKQTRVLLSNPACSQDPQASVPLKPEVPPPSIEPKQPACGSTIQHTGGLVA